MFARAGWPEADSSRWLLAALFTWLAFIAVVGVRVAVAPLDRANVYPVFAAAGRAWNSGTELYGRADLLYRYPPSVAVWLAPLGLLPDRVGTVAWRVINLLPLLLALGAAQGCFLPGLSCRDRALWWLALLPLCVDSINNGQSNPLLLAFMLGGTVAVARQRWLLAGLLLAGAIHLKLYPAALALLLLVVYPRQLTLPLLGSLVLGAVLPFATQSTDYVWWQYGQWIAYLPGDLRAEVPLVHANRDGWLLVRAWDLPLTLSLYMVLQLATATALACLALALRRSPSRVTTTWQLFTLACVWMLVFGPATESSTYLLLAPVLATSLLEVWLGSERRWWCRGLVTLAAGLHASAIFGAALPLGRELHQAGLQPLATLFLVPVLLRRGIGQASQSVAPEVREADADHFGRTSGLTTQPSGQVPAASCTTDSAAA